MKGAKIMTAAQMKMFLTRLAGEKCHGHCQWRYYAMRPAARRAFRVESDALEQHEEEDEMVGLCISTRD